MVVKIKENSLLAKLAAQKMQSPKMAMAFGNTIRLHNTTRQQFLSNTTWVRHEIAHIYQSKQKGTTIFLLHYLWLSFLHGYKKNKYEIEATQKEQDENILANILFN